MNGKSKGRGWKRKVKRLESIQKIIKFEKKLNNEQRYISNKGLSKIRINKSERKRRVHLKNKSKMKDLRGRTGEFRYGQADKSGII